MRRVVSGAFASYVLQSELSELSSRDRGFVTDLVYGTLRHGRYLDAGLAPYLKRPDNLPGDVFQALKLGAYELLVRGTPRRAVVNEWVSVIKADYGKLSGLVNAVLRKLEPPTGLSAATLANVPDWLYEDWQRLFADQAKDVAQAMLEPEPLWLQSYHPDAAARLEAEGCEVAAGPFADSLAVRPSKPLAELAAYQEGLVQPQNPSSSLPVRLLEPRPGERILDLASGNGIKAAQLAAAGADVTGAEVDARKVERAKQNLHRLGLAANHLVHDLRTPPPLEPAAKVLLDAPCTGTGTLRGNPEIRERVTEQATAELARLQLELLRTAAQLTRPGGTLIYAVCALTSRESANVMSRFLAEDKTFSTTPFHTDLPHHATEWGSFILPLNGLDGFFITRLVKAV